MPYSQTLLRSLKFHLNSFNRGKNPLQALMVPSSGVNDLPFHDLVVDTVALNRFEERFTATGSQTAFTIAKSLAAPTGNIMPVQVYRNGTKLKWVTSAPAAGQFTYSGTTITTSSSTVSDIIEVVY